MTYQIFPNRFKTIGKVIFIICASVPFFIGFFQPFKNNENQGLTESFLTTSGIEWLELVAMLGMLIYMLSKEKVEDDYINKLRLESYQITTLLTLISGFIMYFVNHSFKISISYFIFLFLLAFLITFSIKKRTY